MERRGWLQRNEDSARYSIAYHLLRLAHRGTPAHTLTAAAAPVMHDLSTRINQSCHLVVRSGTQGLMILRQENQDRHANLSVRLGAAIELLSSCSGKVLLANLGDTERELLEQSWSRAQTAAYSKLARPLEKIRKQGFAIQRSTITAGVTDMSHPVRGFDGTVVAALTIPYLHALDGSLPKSLEQTRRLLEESAHRVSQSLGWARAGGR